MNRLILALLLGALWLSNAPVAFAEGAAEPAAPNDTSRIDALKAALDAEEEPSDPHQPLTAPRPIAPTVLDAEGRASMQAAFKAYYDYRTQGFDHRKRVFEWQLLSSKIIFVVVIGLVGAGIYFSWLQFRRDLKRSGEGQEPQTSTLEASATGIKVSSPVLGVVILVISLLFFYLYLQYVYPIEEIL